MSEELELLRAANPVPAGEGRWRDRPLDATAERALNRLLHGARTRRARRRLVLRAEAAVLALVAALAFLFTDAGSGRAVAAPAALVPRAGGAAPSLDALARLAEERAGAAGPGDGPRRGSHLQSWSLSMGTGPDTTPPVTVPEERITRWNADGSGSELVVATDPLHPGRPVIHEDAGGHWRTVSDGKVLHRATYPPGSGAGHDGLAARTRPPTDPKALRALLTSLYGAAGTDDKSTAAVPRLLMALSAFRQEWTPGPRESAAIVRVLADTGGLRPAGAVTDRLGRRGLAFVHDGMDGATDAADATRQMVIFDPRTGQLLGTEITFTENLPDFRITAGEVMSYEAWIP
ncbi:CU044_5270 family protein [Streptomyces sp. NPDC056149]|uniref:CU044_5270 family protein n=1 Tax=unclassified Streptomyces TaxID=2593676 RepID=UPI0023812482|nr:CU044_5270 family protein [Streptomyces sp. WZ-12]